ncbi:hypothetical protein NQ318_008680 [Aromia moschata]|uniref:Bardet-Biedl syndrome 1 N-terminal domain-containing protein n=1 Tax=Aromia moschata TaxID=1265417 RepID=A0AAV8XM22_9CUCU|nr:hypothetical protein NQ318_008680 [Aromia moschata]
MNTLLVLLSVTPGGPGTLVARPIHFEILGIAEFGGKPRRWAWSPGFLVPRAQAIVCALDRKFTDLIKRNNVSLPYKESPITCTSTLRKSSYDQYAVSCPIIATESGNVYILDPPTLTILHQSNVCRKEATPFIMTSVGIFDVEYRIIIGCREKLICVLRRGWLEGKVIVQLINNIIDIIVVPGDNFIMVATENQMLTCYTKRGVDTRP